MAFEFHISPETWAKRVEELQTIRAMVAKRLERASERRVPRLQAQLTEIDRRIAGGIPHSVKCRGCGRIDLPSEVRADMDCCRGCGSNNVDRAEPS